MQYAIQFLYGADNHVENNETSKHWDLDKKL